MNPATHFLASWTLANAADLTFRDRALITLCGVVPDVDGLGIIVELATAGSTAPLNWYSRYHHVLCHNIGFGLLLALVILIFSVRRWTALLLAMSAFHFHLFCDLIGSRGPDGYQWPIPYLWPFSRQWQLAWQGQWAFNAWPNIVFTFVLLLVVLYLAWKRGRSPLEMISKKADAALTVKLKAKCGP